MFDIEASFDRDILALQKNRPTVVFTEADDPRIVEAACYLNRFIRPVFLAPECDILELVARELNHLDSTRVEFTLSESTVVDVSRSPLLDEFVEAHQQWCREHDQPIDAASARAWVGAFAAVVVGTTAPCVLTSRADPEESKFYSIALGCRLAKN
jgi:phosphotransacetylase